MPTRRALSVLIVAMLLLAVVGVVVWLTRDASRGRAWHHVPLERLEGRVESADGTVVGDGPPTRKLHFLGSGLPDPAFSDRQELRFGSRLWGVEAPEGRRMVWEVPLGRRPRLSFRPLRRSSEGCTIRYRVAVRSGGKEIPVEDHLVEAAEDPELERFFAPAVVDVSLERWSRKAVEVVLWAEAEGPGCGAEPIAWGSPAVESVGPLPSRPGSEERPNVLLVGLDTLRADHLGAYGRTPSPTPALDRLASESDLFEEAFSTFDTTNPSFASILTGLWAKKHGVYDLWTPLAGSRVTLAERFHDAGWRTYAVISAEHLGPDVSGLGQGFEGVDTAVGQYAAEAAVSQAFGWISSLANTPDPHSPFFLWLHLYDLHTPHTPPRPYAAGLGAAGLHGMDPVDDWEQRREPGLREFEDPGLGGHEELYVDELVYLDRQIDRLYGFLASRDLLENTIMAVVADHGENFGEQGITFRHAGLWDATLHVPLLVRPPGPPGRTGRRLSGLVQTIDLAPTLLRMAGLRPHEPLDGKDLYRLTETGRGRWAVFAESMGGGRMIRTRDHLVMVTEDDHPLVGGNRLFALRKDPEQSADLAGRGRPVEMELRELLQRWWTDRRGAPPIRSAKPPDEAAHRLRALGELATEP